MTEFFLFMSRERSATAAPRTLRVHLDTNNSNVWKVHTNVCFLLRRCFLSSQADKHALMMGLI